MYEIGAFPFIAGMTRTAEFLADKRNYSEKKTVIKLKVKHWMNGAEFGELEKNPEFSIDNEQQIIVDEQTAAQLGITAGSYGDYDLFQLLKSMPISTEDLEQLTLGLLVSSGKMDAKCNYSITGTPIGATATKTDVSEEGAEDGEISLNVIGGFNAYNFEWSNGATTKDISGLAAGTYVCVITCKYNKSEAANISVTIE